MCVSTSRATRYRLDWRRVSASLSSAASSPLPSCSSSSAGLPSTRFRRTSLPSRPSRSCSGWASLRASPTPSLRAQRPHSPGSRDGQRLGSGSSRGSSRRSRERRSGLERRSWSRCSWQPGGLLVVPRESGWAQGRRLLRSQLARCCSGLRSSGRCARLRLGSSPPGFGSRSSMSGRGTPRCSRRDLRGYLSTRGRPRRTSPTSS